MKKNPATLSVHAGSHVPVSNRPEAMPIYQTSVFTFDDLDHLEGYFTERNDRYLYSRNSNPNTTALEKAVAALEGGEDCVATSSGMSAILCGILTFVQAGDHVLCSNEIYGATASLLETELQRLGIGCTFAPFHSAESIEQALQPSTKLLVTEVITNPLISVIDIPMVTAIAHERGAKVLVDNTFTSPYVVRPLELGADLVIHSATKYLNGHNDVTAGVVVGPTETIAITRQRMVLMGCCLGPFEAWLVQRGIKTFALRMRQHSANADNVAAFLAGHPTVQKVYHPSLTTHETYPVARKMELNGNGAMISFRLCEDTELLNQFFRALNMITIAPSLAGVATTLSHPLKTSHRALSYERQQELGITMGLLRLSVGIEEAEDIITDLEKGLRVLR
ncbi:trans-sulfuration enzyme family protein [Aneurinibacillus terranovensis]|uniref:trans-sulfuration enzyme family protein n=1 Tax=Aneurinibacillus terranovensis TaxID=278991 RepID=UPI000409F299|nr:PLP-dependent aspartate aminotransferase family protein [Aneurinibacillus terranovensis]